MEKDNVKRQCKKTAIKDRANSARVIWGSNQIGGHKELSWNAKLGEYALIAMLKAAMVCMYPTDHDFAVYMPLIVY